MNFQQIVFIAVGAGFMSHMPFVFTQYSNYSRREYLVLNLFWGFDFALTD